MCYVDNLKECTEVPLKMTSADVLLLDIKENMFISSCYWKHNLQLISLIIKELIDLQALN